MDHKYIDDFDIVDRYLMGRLAAEETSEFEEHFVDCEHCVDRLKIIKAFIEELRLVEIDQAEEVVARISGGSWYKRRKALALVAGFISLIALAGVVFAFNQARRYEEERQSSAIAESGNHEKERELTEQVSQLKKQFEVARKQAAESSDEINVPILTPISTRASEALPSSNILALPSSPISFLISVALEGETGYRNYRMTIRDSEHQLILNRSGLTRNSINSVSVLLNSRRFQPGDYLLTLESVAPHGSPRLVGQYSFRVNKAK